MDCIGRMQTTIFLNCHCASVIKILYYVYNSLDYIIKPEKEMYGLFFSKGPGKYIKFHINPLLCCRLTLICNWIRKLKLEQHFTTE